MDELVSRVSNADPDVRMRVGQALMWNSERDMRIKMIRQGVTPGRLPSHDGFYAVSFHTSMNAAYTTQNKMRKANPDLETHVHKVRDREWTAEIHVKLKVSEDNG